VVLRNSNPVRRVVTKLWGFVKLQPVGISSGGGFPLGGGTEDSIVKMHGEVILAQPFVEDVVSERGERDTGHSNGDQLVSIQGVSSTLRIGVLFYDLNYAWTSLPLLDLVL
jgi:hypothetical protein